MAIGSRGDEVTGGARVLVRTTCSLLAFAISGPAMQIVDPLVRHVPPFMTFVFAPLALLNFLDYAFGKVACVLLAACVLLVLVNSSINWWTKAALTLSATVTCYLTTHWIGKVNHMW